MKEKYIPGGGCLCHAHSEAECGCDVDWTPREVYELREQRDRLAEALERVLEYQGRFDEEDPESIAAEALAAVEGGSDDN
jgi:hypothetical protein